MNKFFSIVLTITIILTASANVLAFESECTKQYNSLKLSVVNEVSDDSVKNDAVELFDSVGVETEEIYFLDKYYPASFADQWTSIEMEASVAEKIPYDVQDQNCTLDINFKNENGNIVYVMNDIAVDYLYINEWYGEVYGGNINCYLSLVGFEIGLYYADITLNDESGNSYELGEAALNVTDKTILEYVSILNYGGQLTTSTESFYVGIDTLNMFIDYEKLNINLLDSNGEVVAETVSKELMQADKYGSSLIYKLNVTKTLEADNRNSYTLDIQSAQDIELLSEVDTVYISVTANPVVVRAEVTGINTVKIYTENVLPGEYIVTSRYTSDDTIYIKNAVSYDVSSKTATITSDTAYTDANVYIAAYKNNKLVSLKSQQKRYCSW